LGVADGGVLLLDGEFAVVAGLGQFLALDFNGVLEALGVVGQHSSAFGQLLVFATQSFVLLFESKDQPLVFIADFGQILCQLTVLPVHD